MWTVNTLTRVHPQSPENTNSWDFLHSLSYSFEDFCGETTDGEWKNRAIWRKFVNFPPNIPGGGISPIFEVPELVTKTLSAGLWNQRTFTSDEVDNESKWKTSKSFTITPIDLPNLDGLELFYQWGNRLLKPQLKEAIKEFFFINEADYKTEAEYERNLFNKLNSVLNHSLYAYCFRYYRNVPQKLKKFQFESYEDIRSFLLVISNKWVFSNVYCEILKHMICFNYALHKKPLSKWNIYLQKLNSMLGEIFKIELWTEEGKFISWHFTVKVWGSVRTIRFKKRSRAKDIFSIEQKLVGSPKENDESIFNDILWAEYIFEGATETEKKTNLLFFLSVLFEKFIVPNRTTYITEKGVDQDDDAIMLESLLDKFEFRQKGLLSDTFIKYFIAKYGPNLTGTFIFTLRKLNKLKKVGTSDNYQDVKFQGPFSFWPKLKHNSVEIRAVLSNNQNEYWLGHSTIRKGLKIILAQIRKWYYVTENYVYRIAYIMHMKSNRELPVDEIFEYYMSQLTPFTYFSKKWIPVTVDRVYTTSAQTERLAEHGFKPVWMRNFNGADLK